MARAQQPTGIDPLDALLADLLAQLDAAFPGRVRSFYLSGSHVSGEATAESDVDGLVVFRGVLSAEDRQRYGAMVNAERYLAERRS